MLINDLITNISTGDEDGTTPTNYAFTNISRPPRRPASTLEELEGAARQFFTFTDLTLVDDNKLSNKAKNAYLATLLGSEGSRILMVNSVAPAASTNTYDDFAEKVKALLERPANPVWAEFEFRSRKQDASETVSEYMTTLRTLYSERTHTANNDNHDLAMQLVTGCYLRHTQEKLLAEPTVALNRFVQIMEADEPASTSFAVIRNEATVATANFNKHSTYKNK